MWQQIFVSNKNAAFSLIIKTLTGWQMHDEQKQKWRKFCPAKTIALEKDGFEAQIFIVYFSDNSKKNICGTKILPRKMNLI